MTQDSLGPLEKLRSISIFGKSEIETEAAKPVPWLWRPYVVAGTVVMVGGLPGSGKTALLFLIMIARASGEFFLTGPIAKAPEGQFVVVVEGEGSSGSAARRFDRYSRLLGPKAVAALDRILVVSRKSVIVGDVNWKYIQQAVKDGYVSDILLDTLASTTDVEANDEQAQNKLFRGFSTLVRSSPQERPLTLWIAGHHKKNGQGDMRDVSGSIQRIAQCDTVMSVEAVRDKSTGHVKYTEISFGKFKEELGEGDMAGNIRYQIGPRGIILKNISGKNNDATPPRDRILAAIEKSTEPMTRRLLRLKLGIRDETITRILDELMAEKAIEGFEIEGRTGKTTAYKKR